MAKQEQTATPAVEDRDLLNEFPGDEPMEEFAEKGMTPDPEQEPDDAPQPPDDEKPGADDTPPEPEAAEEPTEPAEAAPDDLPGEEEVAESVLVDAVEKGLTRELAANLARHGLLEGTLAALDRREVESFRKSDAEPETPPEPPPAKPQAEQKPQGQPESVVGLDLTAIEEYDPTVGAAFRALQGEITQRDERLTALESYIEREQMLEQEAWFDGRLGALGDAGDKLFGKGRGADLDKNGDTYKHRARLYSFMLDKMTLDAAKGRNISREQVFDQALRAEFPEFIEENVRASLTKSLKKQAGTTGLRPTQRQARKAYTAHQEALERMQAVLDEKGINMDESGEEALRNDFPE